MVKNYEIALSAFKDENGSNFEILKVILLDLKTNPNNLVPASVKYIKESKQIIFEMLAKKKNN